jgi:hypothetical protein
VACIGNPYINKHWKSLYTVQTTAEPPTAAHWRSHDILQLVDQKVTEVERKYINLVDQTDSAHLKLPEGNTLQLAQALGFNPIPIQDLSIGPQPVAVAYATAFVIEEAPGDTGRGLSPISREQGQPENTRQRTDDGFFTPSEDEPEADRHEDEYSGEERVPDTVASACEANGQEDVRDADEARTNSTQTNGQIMRMGRDRMILQQQVKTK